MAKCSSEQRESPWSIEGRCGPGFCPALRHGWPVAKCSSEQRESPRDHRGTLRVGLLLCTSSWLADGQMFLRAARKPSESSRGIAGRAFALHFVTVGRWPNVPQSSAKALGVAEGLRGPGFCPALRHGLTGLQKSSRSCKTLLYYTGYYRQNKALNCELFCSGYGAAPKNTTKDTTPLCFVL